MFFSEKKRREEEENKLRIKRQKEESAKAKLDAAKKEKENAKRALKRERKTLQNLAKQNDYFSSSEADLVTKMTDMDRLCELLSAVEYVPNSFFSILVFKVGTSSSCMLINLSTFFKLPWFCN